MAAVEAYEGTVAGRAGPSTLHAPTTDTNPDPDLNCHATSQQDDQTRKITPIPEPDVPLQNHRTLPNTRPPSDQCRTHLQQVARCLNANLRGRVMDLDRDRMNQRRRPLRNLTVKGPADFEPCISGVPVWHRGRQGWGWSVAMSISFPSR